MKIYNILAHLVTCAVVCCACRYITGIKLLDAPSPLGNNSIGIWKLPHGPDVSVRITAVSLSGERTIYRDNHDRLPTLVEVAWTDKENRAGILVCDGYAEKIIIGYDFQHSRVLSKEGVLESLRAGLIRRYGLTAEARAKYNGDIITWACQSDAARKMFYHVVSNSKRLRPLPIREISPAK